MRRLVCLRPLGSVWIAAALVGSASACGNPELVMSPSSGAAGAGGAEPSGGAGQGGDLFASASSSGSGGSVGDPCDGIDCPPDQHCEAVDDMATCVNNDCATLMCGPTEICEPTAGGGAICVDIGCAQDVDCVPSQYCDGTICVDDICLPGATSCQGQDLYECASNGGAVVLKYSCASQASFVSQCIDDGMGSAYCTCADDWDCAQYTACEGGKCQGSGFPPTCFLPPEPFTSVLPTPEIVWGGTFADPTAVGSAFPASAQVVQAPIVANLDDDNGDGVIDDLDVPEIVFTTFCNSDFTSNGILRAIHGGGPNKGADFFATCGTTTWHEGDDPAAVSCTCATAALNSTSGLAVGDLDGDGVPEIVGIAESSTSLQIFKNTGERMSAATTPALGGNPAPTLANLDGVGAAEIVVGRHAFSVEKDATGNVVVVDTWSGALNTGANGQGPVSCIADLDGDGRAEIAAGTTAYRFPMAPPGAIKQADCTGAEVDPDEIAWCAGQLLVKWDAASIAGNGVPAGNDDGFCAIADVLGVDTMLAPSPSNPLDDLPEVIVVANANLYVLDGQTGTKLRDLNPNEGIRGGPPNVDDFDGDGFPEIGTAYGAAYVVFDLQDPVVECPAWPNKPPDDATTCESVNTPRTPPALSCAADADCAAVTAGTVCNERTQVCVCLHNGWKRTTEDDSSRVTGSSVFDFNGDGAAEVIYNDECRFRIYDGIDGEVYMAEPSESRTRIEYPIVADVDNDGNAEIVFATTNESGFCSQNLDSLYNNGIEVWGDSNDFWVPARRVWNQHAYNVTNVTEAGRIPPVAPEHWKTWNGREYDIFRSNPRTLGIAPDLVPTAVQVSSPNVGCGMLSDELTIVAQIQNKGDVRVGPGVVVGFHGTWNNPMVNEPLYAAPLMTPLVVVLGASIEPGASVFVSVAYDAANNSPMTLPDTITVVVDETDLERECDETNNAITIPVEAGGAEPDLRVELGAPLSSPCPTVPTTVFNDGTADASGVIVRYFAGNPSQGGTALHDEAVPGTLAAGQSVSFDVTIPNFPQGLDITIWGVVDPDNVIDECNDGNNADPADGKIQCGGVN